MLKETLIKTYDLQSHPEGGYFKEIYRSRDVIETNSLSNGFSGPRNICTSIYFLIEKNNFSAFHRIKSDETWHFYDGDPLEVIEIDEEGILRSTHIGRDIENGQTYQYTVKAGNWFASRVLTGGEFSFVGCTVAPGFDFSDFELADRNELCSLFPKHRDVIVSLTRQ